MSEEQKMYTLQELKKQSTKWFLMGLFMGLAAMFGVVAIAFYIG